MFSTFFPSIPVYPQYKAKMGNRPSVLIIESRQNTRTTLEMTLSSEGIRVFSAVTLGSALLQLRVLQPDLIIIGFDAEEPGESVGMTRIKALSSAPLLALANGNSAPPEHGISDTLPYPLNAGQLCTKVVELLNGSDKS